MDRTRFPAPSGSLATAVAAFPRGPRIAFAPFGDGGADRAAAEFKAVTDEVKAFAETSVTEFRRLGGLAEAHGRSISETKAVAEAASRAVEDAEARMTLLEQKAARRGGGTAVASPSIGQAFVESDQFKSFVSTSGRRGTFVVQSNRDALEFKNLTTVAGSGAALLPPDYRPDVVALPYRDLSVRDLVAPGQTSANAVEYPRMTARLNNAGTVPELGLKPQSDLQFEMVTAPVRTIAHFFYGSRQLFDDAPALRSLIDVEARYGLRLVEDQQMLYGDGTAQNLFGVMPQAQPFAPSWTSGGATPLDVLIAAIAQVEAGDYPCTGMVINKTDWRMMQSIKDGVGRYLSAGPFGAENTRSIWDVPVAATNNMPAGSYLVGPFRDGAQIFDRMDVEVVMSTEDGDNFRRNAITLRAEERLAFTVRRPKAFVTGTYAAGAAALAPATGK